jgi:hypothetical protein
MHIRTSLLVFSLSFGLGMAQSVQSPTCGQVDGKTAKDRDNALAFCAKNIVKGAVTSINAMESILWVKITREFADELRADRLSAEELVRIWMRAWKYHSGSKSVTVFVEWRSVEIAKGETTLFSGDKVTIK